jgi:toxin-antitoxin system PIN domain toxin
MKLCDVNVLIYAHRPDASPEHSRYQKFLSEMVYSNSAFGISEAVLSSFVRIVTNSRAFKDPTPVETAFAFCNELKTRPQACILRPNERNWSIFQQLCTELPASGKLVADAWHAALAIEYDCEWISTDSDFSRFPGLRWKHPLSSS